MYAQKTILMHYNEPEAIKIHEAEMILANTYNMLKENDCEYIENPCTGEIKTVDDIIKAMHCLNFLHENPLYELV